MLIKMLETDQIKIDLNVVSSIMNFAGYQGLLNYLSIETYKKVVKDEYVNCTNLAQFSFLDEETWIKHMDLLVEMELATKNGSKYITRRKLKNWHGFANEKTPDSLTLNGSIVFNMTEIYKKKNDLKDLLYLSLVENIMKGRSISRSFITKLTGFNKYAQRSIEERYNGTLVEKVTHHMPVTDSEQTINKLEKMPVFYGVISPKHMYCTKTSKDKSNCKVIQQGNKLKIKKLNLSYFVKSKSVKSKRSNDFLKGKEVWDWDNFDMVLDTSSESKSNKFRGMLSTADPRKMSWKDFYRYNYNNVGVISDDGSFCNIRSILNP